MTIEELKIQIKAETKDLKTGVAEAKGQMSGLETKVRTSSNSMQTSMNKVGTVLKRVFAVAVIAN